MDEWKIWKSRMEFTFNGSGYERVLINAIYDTWKSQLAVETVGETVNNLVKKYEYDKNGYGEWNALCGWYDGDEVKNETSDYLKSKL